jgi:methionyl-tRNA formyltransferase
MYAGNIPGRIVSISEEGVIVLCGKGQIILQNIMTPSNKCVEANNFFSSVTTTLGK